MENEVVVWVEGIDVVDDVEIECDMILERWESSVVGVEKAWTIVHWRTSRGGQWVG